MAAASTSQAAPQPKVQSIRSLQAAYDAGNLLCTKSSHDMWEEYHDGHHEEIENRLLKSYDSIRTFINLLRARPFAQYMDPMLLVWWATNGLPEDLGPWLKWSLEKFAMGDRGVWRDPVEYFALHLEVWAAVWRDPELITIAKTYGWKPAYSMSRLFRRKGPREDHGDKVRKVAWQRWRWLCGEMDVEMVDVDDVRLAAEKAGNAIE